MLIGAQETPHIIINAENSLIFLWNCDVFQENNKIKQNKTKTNKTKQKGCVIRTRKR